MYGENLYWSWSSDPSWELPAEEAVTSWYDEKSGYDFAKEPLDTDSGKDLFHTASFTVLDTQATSHSWSGHRHAG